MLDQVDQPNSSYLDQRLGTLPLVPAPFGQEEMGSKQTLSQKQTQVASYVRNEVVKVIEPVLNYLLIVINLVSIVI